MHQFNRFVSQYNNACSSNLKYFKFGGYNTFILKFCTHLYKNGIIKEYTLYRNNLYVFLKNNSNDRSYPRIYSMLKKKKQIYLRKKRHMNHFFGLILFTNSKGLQCTSAMNADVHGILVAYVL